MSDENHADSFVASRRKFLASCGKFAVITPPSLTLMLVAADQSFAVAASGNGGSPTVRGGGAGGFGGGFAGNFGSVATDAGALTGSAVALRSNVPPECADIQDPVERAKCVAEVARRSRGDGQAENELADAPPAL